MSRWTTAQIASVRAARKEARAQRRAEKEKMRVARELERRRLQEDAEAERAYCEAVGRREEEGPKEDEGLQLHEMGERGDCAWEKID